MNATTLSKRSTGKAAITDVKGKLCGILRVILPWLLPVSIIGCATPTTLISTVEGLEITEHLDAEMPHGCEQAFPTGGCYQFQDGKHHIWYSAVSFPYVREHEIAHALGMRHSVPWIWDGKQSCATVTVSGDGYQQGQRICVDSHGEHGEGTMEYAIPTHIKSAPDIGLLQQTQLKEAQMQQMARQTKEPARVLPATAQALQLAKTKVPQDVEAPTEAQAEALEAAETEPRTESAVVQAFQHAITQIREALTASAWVGTYANTEHSVAPPTYAASSAALAQIVTETKATRADAGFALSLRMAHTLQQVFVK